MTRSASRSDLPPGRPRVRRSHAKKSLGQHFLCDMAIVDRIAGALELSSDETVIEIGAGHGVLTDELARRAGRVVAIELDDQLAELLRERFKGTNVEIVHGDALGLTPARLLGGEQPYVLAGNLPYNVAQPLLRHYLEATPPPNRLVTMLQSEVADSIVAEPGAMSLLGVSVQLYGRPSLLFRVPPSAFRPPPKVRSAVVRIDVAPALHAPARDTAAFFRLVRAGFSSRRKQLRNSLAHGLRIDAGLSAAIIAEAGIDPTMRPQALSLEEWAVLDRSWTDHGRPDNAR